MRVYVLKRSCYPIEIEDRILKDRVIYRHEDETRLAILWHANNAEQGQIPRRMHFHANSRLHGITFY